jgi:hypothetical protein
VQKFETYEKLTKKNNKKLVLIIDIFKNFCCKNKEHLLALVFFEIGVLGFVSFGIYCICSNPIINKNNQS